MHYQGRKLYVLL